MFETLMKAGSHRVDYLNDTVRGRERAFAFYVYGDLPANAAYSTTAKHRLYAGLTLIKQTLGYENLIAVYLDVQSVNQNHRPAYEIMKEDLRAGIFKRIFVLHTADLTADEQIAEDLARFYQEVGGFDLLTFEQGAFKPILLMCASALA